MSRKENDLYIYHTCFALQYYNVSFKEQKDKEI